MSFQASATIAPTLRQSQAGERSTQPVRAPDHRPTEPIGATTPGPSQSADGLQVVSRVKATRVPGRPPANEPAGASTSATASAERRTSGTPASAPARAGAEDLVSFPPQFPLDQRDGPLGKLGNMFAPRFADEHFERRYHQHSGQGLDSVLLVFWSVTAVFALCLWGYHATSKNGFDRPARIGINLVHGNLLIGLVFWAVLRFLPRTRAHSSALLGLMTCMLTTLYTWGLPATARETCQDVYNTFDSNLHQTVFTCLAFAAVFCRIGTGAFALVCLVTSANLCATAPASELQPLEPQTPHCTWHGPPTAPRPQPRDPSPAMVPAARAPCLAPCLSPRRSITARSSWSELEQHGFAATFELPKLLATLFIIFAGVRCTDVYLRRDFAARELMLMVIEQQAREMEDALKAAAEMGREMDSATLLQRRARLRLRGNP